ncbi:MAG: hypothetical protein KJ057_07450 [Phycisphaerae bacterium]|nr:MAG: hypothetical protein EDS66_04455 [Planctomycetota bacterium]MBE7457018.1 hypothetical protein [Planctomycetia bacterium]MCL4718292.1 hypothetical protein [Phycisphaerae bacterium]MCQ3920402.1 hypothetical protein [Planctomycetota bacterium]
MTTMQRLGSLSLLVIVGSALGQETGRPAGDALVATPDPGKEQHPAGFFFSRSELEDLLVGGGTKDDFERYSIADGNSQGMRVFDLSDTTIVNGQGPGLVNDGAIYFSAGELFWLGNGAGGVPTKTIVAVRFSMAVAYDIPAQVMGFDLHALAGSPSTTKVEAFSPNGQSLGSTTVTVPDDGTPVFVGFRHDAGIGVIEFSNLNRNHSPIINDHQYGSICSSDGCNGAELLTAKVREKTCGCQVQAILKRGTPGSFYGFKMPNGECVSAEANRRGKAKVKQCPSRGGKVFVTSCSLEARVRCP